MELTRNNDELGGKYFYEKTREETGFRKCMSLTGTMREDGTFTLKEFEESEQTGTFQGKFRNEVRGAESSLQMTGTWAKTGSNKSMPFSATEYRVDLGPGLKLKSTEHKEESKNYSLSATYPQLEGDSRAAKFNDAVVKLVANEMHFEGDSAVKPPAQEKEKNSDDADAADLPGSAELGYEVTAANSELISILFGILNDGAGAAHSNFNSLAMNYDLKAGKVLGLADLFKDDSNFLKVISDYCIRSLAKQNVSDGGSEAPDRQWRITRAGMLFAADC
jgi:hypothetical protein